MATKWTYSFGGGKADGSAKMRNLLGGKGANLHEMSSIGVAVPPGFTITTEVCQYFTETDGTYPDDLKAQVAAAVAQVESLMNSTFGRGEQVLLLSVRSGARASMPGMMDTVLNLGLNEDTVETLARSEERRVGKEGRSRWAADH